MRKIRLAVIFYGQKTQYQSNQQQFDYLTSELRDFVLQKYDWRKSERVRLLEDYQRGKIDVVLKNAYGRGHEIEVESFLEYHRLPFFGAGAKATLIATSKFLSKAVFRAHGLPVINDMFIDRYIWAKSPAEVLRGIKKDLGYPIVIKDSGGVDSRGLYLVKTPARCRRLLSSALTKYGNIIIERYINADREVTCLVTGGKKPIAYEPVGIGKKGDMFLGRHKDKLLYQPQIPADLAKETIKAIKEMAVSAHQALGARTFSRSDFLVQGKRTYLLETDVHPGFRKTSPTTLSVKHRGQTLNGLFLSFYQVNQQWYDRRI